MHQEALTSELKNLWQKIKSLRDFTLVGGTALALQIGHRVSVDFDFFSNKELPPDLLTRIESIFQNSPVKILLNTSGQLTTSVQGVNITFVRYPFPVLHPPIEFEGIKLAPVIEIAAMKAYALGRRATYKDYVDLYFILAEKHCTLQELTDTAQRKYEDQFNARLFFEQLVYMRDVPTMEIPFLRNAVRRETLEGFFYEEIKRIEL